MTIIKNHSLFDLVEVALYAAIIILAIAFIHIPMPSAISNSFVHPGNALVVLSVLMMGPKKGTAASMIGLGLYDLMSGYAAEVIFTLLENLIVIAVVILVYDKLMKKQDTTRNIITVGIIAAVTKVITIFIKFTIQQLLLGSGLHQALTVAVTGMPASIFTGLVTAILVLVLYPPMKAVVQRFHPVGE